MIDSTLVIAFETAASMPFGNEFLFESKSYKLQSWSWNQETGSPSFVVPCRFAPFPPKRSFRSSLSVPAFPAPTKRQRGDSISSTDFLADFLIGFSRPSFSLYFPNFQTCLRCTSVSWSANSFLRHRVTMTNGHCLVGQWIIVNGHAKRGTDFILPAIPFTNWTRIIRCSTKFLPEPP